MLKFADWVIGTQKQDSDCVLFSNYPITQSPYMLLGTMRSVPMYGRSTSGTITLPSACW